MGVKTSEIEQHRSAAEAVRSDARRNREAVVEAAIVALAADPNASMADIAEAAGVGRTTVYRHFDTREELIGELFQRVVAEARQATGSVIESGDDTATTLRALGPAMVEIGERFRFLHSHIEIGAAALADSIEIADDPVRMLLVEGQERGSIRADAPIGWMQSLMQSTAMATMDQVHAGQLSLEDAGRLLGDTFVAAFIAS